MCVCEQYTQRATSLSRFSCSVLFVLVCTYITRQKDKHAPMLPSHRHHHIFITHSSAQIENFSKELITLWRGKHIWKKKNILFFCYLIHIHICTSSSPNNNENIKPFCNNKYKFHISTPHTRFFCCVCTFPNFRGSHTTATEQSASSLNLTRRCGVAHVKNMH